MSKKLRVLIAVHPEFRPDRAKAGATETDVWRAVKRLGYVAHIVPVSDELRSFEKELKRFRPDIVFNLVEEFRGEAIFDFHLVGLLEALGIPFTGCNPRGLVVSRNKLWVSQLAMAAGVAVPACALAGDRKVKALIERGPVFVKFNREHASLGIRQTNRVENPSKLRTTINRMKTTMNSEVLVQQFVPGAEVSVGVWGNGRPEAFSPWRLHLGDRNGFATERVKFSSKFRRRRGIRARKYTGPEREQIQTEALRLFKLLDLSGYARFDYRISDDGVPFLIDVNPNPNLAQNEDFACSAREMGTEYPQLIEGILKLGLNYRPRV